MTKLRKDPKGWAPTLLTETNTVNDTLTGKLSQGWKYVISNPACYSADIFTEVNLELIMHPERNTKNIRRTDILSDSETESETRINEDREKERQREQEVPGMLCVRTIRRQLMPRNPNFDAELQQTCQFYAVEGEESTSLVIYRNHFIEGEKIPYYIPSVKGIAFELYQGNIYLAYLPLSGLPSMDERLNRTALHLLQTLHRHCIGTQEGYQKRVHHDLVVSKSAYQDLYINLKNKYAKHLISNWIESTDPRKHVFEDISITAFLILLWEQGQGKETKFVDIGCGNGVLVYLLTMEGYQGYGFDARKRKSWSIFPEQVQKRLLERILIPYFLTMDIHYYDGGDENIHDGRFEEGYFLISNHADELIPYTPLLAALTPKSSFLAIPCCEHDFSGSKSGGGSLATTKATLANGAVGTGRYGIYCEWISQIAKEMGWIVEREMLRIPSTRNIGIIGRKIDGSMVKNKELVLEVIGRLGGKNGVQGFVERALGLKERVHGGH